MASEITMPQQSDTMTEGTVVKWLKKEGDKVKQGEIIAEIETDKATMEMEAFESGTIASILVPEGGKVPVGAAIAVLATGKENPAEVKKQFAGKPAPSAAVAAPRLAESVSQTPRKQADSAGSERVPAAAAHGGTVATLEGASVGELHERDGIGHGATQGQHGAGAPAGDGNGHGNRVFASPLARRIAADKEIDLSQVRGTGPGGRIVQKDVLDFAQKSTPARQTTTGVPPAPRGTQVVPLTKMRSAIAAALQRSKQQIPHFYEAIDVDVEELSALRVRLNEQLKTQNVKLSLADFVTKAVTAALLRHPALNATFDGSHITRHGDVHLGIAVAVPDGLIVPVLRNADRFGLREIREKSASLIERARSQRLKQDEMTGGTFTISSLGTFGIREFSAIINPPQVAILAIGTAEKRPVVRDNQIVARAVMTLTLSADHRVVDGATAAEFLRTLKAMLEEPGMMLV